MGYRSEVIAAVPIKDKEKALKIIDDWDDTTKNLMTVRGLHMTLI